MGVTGSYVVERKRLLGARPDVQILLPLSSEGMRNIPIALPGLRRGVTPSENFRNQPIAYALCIIPISRQFML